MGSTVPKIGGHVSAAVSLEKAFENAAKIGAECMQIFISPPQQWAFTKHDDEEIERFKRAASETQIGPNFIHGCYLVNLSTEKEDHLQRSINWLTYGMHMAEKLGINGVIFHTGSHKGKGLEGAIDQVVSAIKQVLSKTQKSDLILETSAGGGGSIGRDFVELGRILKLVGDDRVKVCIDTAHTFAAGYDWRTNIDEVLAEFDREIGFGKLAAIHANDSKMDLETNKDRHANIGEGFIGKAAFELMLNHSKLKDVPFLLEVPGFADTGPDLENVNILKSLRKV